MIARPRLRPAHPGGLSVYLWDDSDNLAGSHKQRAAYAVAAAAVRDGWTRIVVGSCGPYGVAMALASAERQLVATVVIPRSSEALTARLEAAGARPVVVRGGYEDAVSESRSLATRQHAADGNVDGPYARVVRCALGCSALELLRALGDSPPRSLWIPVGNGTTLVAFGEALRRAGVTVPLTGVTSAGHNSVLANWPQRTHRPLPRDAVRMTAARSALVNWNALDGQEALDVIHETNGTIVGVDDAALILAASRLGREGVAVSASGAAAVAGMMTYPQRLRPGVNVAVLTGR